MKYFYTFIITFILLLNNVFAETITVPVTIDWQGIERQYADSLYREIITFEGALHNSDNPLPAYHYAIPADHTYSYTAKLENVSYLPLEAVEQDFLKDIQIPGTPQTETYLSTSRNGKTFHILVHPILQEDGQILKLNSFDIIINKDPELLKSKYSNTIHTYASRSVLSQGNFIKVRITESGVYKLTYSDLRSKGIEPSNVRMFGYGGAMLSEDFSKAKYDDLPEIAVYDTGSAILFYAQGINKWNYDSSLDMFTHTLNPYSNYGYYFITSDDVGEKKRFGAPCEIDPGSAAVNEVTEFTAYSVYEKELVNLVNSGREFYGERFSAGSSMDISMNFPNIIKNSSSLNVNVSVAGSTSGSTSVFTFRLNGNSQGGTISVPAKTGYYNAIGRSSNFNITPTSDNITFTLAYSSSESTATGYLNFIEVNALCKLKMQGNSMTFHNKSNISANSYNRYILDTDNSNIQIWDISDLENVIRIDAAYSNGKVRFTDIASAPKSYVAIDPTVISSVPSATLLEQVPNQNIHGMEPVDMLIITHPSFVDAANTLAQAHYEIDGLKVGVVTTEQVYNEFSSGTPDASAYRWVTKMFYDKPQNSDDKIRYLLLFGKGSYDNRGLFSSTGDKMVLTYQAVNSLSTTASYVTDDYFGLMDDNEGTSIGNADELDIGIGRFPVTTSEDAWGVVEKTIKYMRNENNGAWKNHLCFVGDDGDNNGHMRDINRIADAVTLKNPSYHATKILLDAYHQEVNASGESYPGATTQFHNLIRSGLFYIAYMGHANASGWANEQIFTYNHANSLTNKNLALFAAGTCEFSRFDKAGISAGEEVVRNTLGGGIGCFSAARTVFMSPNYTLLNNFTDVLFHLEEDRHMAIGDAVMKAKNLTKGDPENKLSYVYFGDPAVKMHYPNQYNVVVKDINDTPVSGNDTLRALSVNTVEGIISDSYGNINTGFNGTLQIIVLDKEEDMVTLANDAGSSPFEYKDRPNIIFRGTTTVQNGNFKFTFMLPKDIKYNYGSGRMVFYAWDNENTNFEAQGYCEDFIVGGSSNDIEDVTAGPQVNMYLNHEGFISGAKVNETPVFIANVYDNYGINISSPTPGHDIMLVVDNDYSYVLNEYYEAKLDTYKEGTVNFQMPELPEGYYTLMFRVWNLYNISTVEYLDFQVVKNLSPELFSVICYPNPAVTETNILVRHDRKDEILSMTLDVYDITGKKIWSETQNNSAVIKWNLTKSTGEKVPPGVYIYRVSIKDGNKITSSKANKIIIKGQ